MSDITNPLSDELNRCSRCGGVGPLCDFRQGMRCTSCGRPWQSVASAKRQEAVTAELRTELQRVENQLDTARAEFTKHGLVLTEDMDSDPDAVLWNVKGDADNFLRLLGILSIDVLETGKVVVVRVDGRALCNECQQKPSGGAKE